MPTYTIPKHAGKFVVLVNRKLGYTVANGDFARATIKIPARDKRHAEQLRDRLNRGDHDGTIRA